MCYFHNIMWGQEGWGWVHLSETRNVQKILMVSTATDKNERMNSIWVRALPGPMHLGLKTGPLCPPFCVKLKEPCARWPLYLVS